MDRSAMASTVMWQHFRSSRCRQRARSRSVRRMLRKRAGFRVWRPERECVTRDDVSPTTTCRDGSPRRLREWLCVLTTNWEYMLMKSSLLAFTLAAALAAACSHSDQQKAADSAPSQPPAAQPASPPPPAPVTTPPPAETAPSPAELQKSAAATRPAPSPTSGR